MSTPENSVYKTRNHQEIDQKSQNYQINTKMNKKYYNNVKNRLTKTKNLLYNNQQPCVRTAVKTVFSLQKCHYQKTAQNKKKSSK
jgi:hypothetical protein